MTPTAQATRIVQQAVDASIADGEIGVQVAVYLRGKLIVDVWAGRADETREVDGKTLFPVFHMTKAAGIIAVQVQAERGLIDCDAPVARYWPAFGAHGKAKGTVRDLLIQRLGVPQMPDGVTVEQMCDWDWMVERLADMKPMYEPGTVSAYHAYTIGWILGELVQRTDVKQRRFTNFVQEEICIPLGIEDLWIGISDEVEPRIATVTNFPAGTLDPSYPLFKAMPPQVFACQEVFGRPDVRRACLPGIGGIWKCSKRRVKLFAILAGNGQVDGVRLLSEARVRSFAEPRPRSDEVDRMLLRPIGSAMGGFYLGGPSPPGDPIAGYPHVLCHSGAGGTTGWADPHAGFSAAICHNRMLNMPTRDGNPLVGVADAVREAVAVADGGSRT